MPEYDSGSYPDTTHSIKGLEEVEDKLTKTQKKVLDVILTDTTNEENLTVKRMYKQLAAACSRAGMSNRKKDFYNTIKDPEFVDVVRRVGTGLIGIHIVPLVSKLIELAIEENDKDCLFKALKIATVLPDKYSIFAHQAMIKGGDQWNVGEVNLGNTPDKKVRGVINAIEYEPEAQDDGEEAGALQAQGAE